MEGVNLKHLNDMKGKFEEKLQVTNLCSSSKLHLLGEI